MCSCCPALLRNSGTPLHRAAHLRPPLLESRLDTVPLISLIQPYANQQSQRTELSGRARGRLRRRCVAVDAQSLAGSGAPLRDTVWGRRYRRVVRRIRRGQSPRRSSAGWLASTYLFIEPLGGGRTAGTRRHHRLRRVSRIVLRHHRLRRCTSSRPTAGASRGSSSFGSCSRASATRSSRPMPKGASRI